jgi:hypothetical protein
MLLTKVSPHIQKKECTLKVGNLIETETYCYTEMLGNRWNFRGYEYRKLWDSLSELRSSLCERRLESSEACANACQNRAVLCVKDDWKGQL